MPISFPGLFGDWECNIDPIALHIGHGVYWYGIILAVAMLAGLLLCIASLVSSSYNPFLYFRF